MKKPKLIKSLNPLREIKFIKHENKYLLMTTIIAICAVTGIILGVLRLTGFIK